MAYQTLLDMTQEILSAMSSDEVDSISDTTESMQVATIVKRKYYDILSRGGLTPKEKKLFQLTASGDVSLPVLMYVPDGVANIESIKYFDSSLSSGVATGYTYVTILPIAQFIDHVTAFNPDESNVETFTFSQGSENFTFYYKTDCRPSFCTIISNYYVVFDTLDIAEDTTLQASKTMCYGLQIPTFSMTDSFIPSIDEEQFPLLLNEAKALAFYELKQMPHQKAEQEIKRQWSTTQKNKAVANSPTSFEQLPDFGRRTRTGGFSGPRFRFR